MSDIVFYLLIAILCVSCILMIIRGRIIVSLSRCNGDKDWKKMIDITKNRVSSILLSNYIRDLNVAKAFVIKNDMPLLKKQLRTMMKKHYNESDSVQYLTLYYHMFFVRGDIDFALEILASIEATKNESLVKYSVWTKEVLIDKRADLISTMEKAIENKEFYGFPLGVVTYLIAIQYEYAKDYQQALDWLGACTMIFQPDDIYIKVVNAKIVELKAIQETLEPSMVEEPIEEMIEEDMEEYVEDDFKKELKQGL